MKLALSALLALAFSSFAAEMPEETVRDFIYAETGGDSARAAAMVSPDAPTMLRNDVRNDVALRCFEYRSMHLRLVHQDEKQATIEMKAHLVRTAHRSGVVNESLDQRTFLLERRDGGWLILDMRLAEEALIDRIVAAKTDAEVTALLASAPELITPSLARRLTLRAIHVGRAGAGRSDLRLATIALDIAEATGDDAAVAVAMATQADAIRVPATLTRMRALAEEALRIAEASREPVAIAYCIATLADSYTTADSGSREAERLLRGALARPEEFSAASVTQLRQDLSMVLFSRGDYAAAYRELAEGLALDNAARREQMAGFKEVQIGKIMEAQSDPELALEYFRRAAKRPITKPFVIIAHLGMAEASRALGRYDEAKTAADKALEIAQGSELKGLVARALVAVTELRIESGETANAEAMLRQAIELAKEGIYRESHVSARVTLGNLYFREGRIAEAKQLAEEANAIATRSDFPSPLRYTALMLAARSARALGNRDEAIALYRNAVDGIEATRGDVAGSERQQRLFFEPYHAAYTELSDLMLERGAVEDALLWAERGKGRVLLDVMARERKRAESALPEEDAKKLAALVHDLGEANKRMVALRTSAETTAAAFASAGEQQRRAQLALDHFDSEVANRDPALRAVRAGSAIIDRAALDGIVTRSDVALLEYVVQDRATHLFVVTRRGDRSAVSHHRIDVPAAELRRRVEAFSGELAGRDLLYTKSARALYDLLLAPAAQELAGKRVLGIVPDGVLWRLPFEVLVQRDGRHLVERAACFYVPSLSIYRDMLARRNDAPPERTLAAFGNPRIEGARQGIEAVYRGIELAPLPDAEAEATAIAKLWGPKSAVYTREDAREDVAKREMERARIVHFAAHGVFDDANPMFSQIVLARGAGSEDDGVLQAWELLRLDLAADLVVFSACETARGRYGAGEGLIGMSWALFASGCPSTLVAQWKVSSRSTATLMVAFHRHLARGTGQPFAKAEALRAAQLAMLRDPRTAHPYYWAGFVLLGSAS